MEIGFPTLEKPYLKVIKIQFRTGFVRCLESLSTIPVGAFGRTADPDMDGPQSSHTFRARRPDVIRFVRPGADRICTRRWRSSRACENSVLLILQFRSGMSKFGFGFDALRSRPAHGFLLAFRIWPHWLDAAPRRGHAGPELRRPRDVLQ